uniref:Uncharacterized protein n=1 Tax=Amphiprion percula TaxID=161767 RepID=A0A3P8S6E7_AMPPE
MGTDVCLILDCDTKNFLVTQNFFCSTVSPPLMSGSNTTVRTIAYDAYGQRVRIREMGLVGNGTSFMDGLLLFSQYTYYEIDWKRFTCSKWKLVDDFFPMQVPKDAKLTAQVVMGASSFGGMGVLVNNWYGSLPGNGKMTQIFNTFNWVVGLSNPMDFTPPSICDKAQWEKTQQTHTFFTLNHVRLNLSDSVV